MPGGNATHRRSADTIVAAARAYVHALNKLLVKRERTEPPPVAVGTEPCSMVNSTGAVGVRANFKRPASAGATIR